MKDLQFSSKIVKLHPHKPDSSPYFVCQVNTFSCSPIVKATQSVCPLLEKHTQRQVLTFGGRGLMRLHFASLPTPIQRGETRIWVVLTTLWGSTHRKSQLFCCFYNLN